MLTIKELSCQTFYFGGSKLALPFGPLPMADINEVRFDGSSGLTEMYCNVGSLTRVELNFDRVIRSKQIAALRRKDEEFSAWLDKKYKDGSLGPGNPKTPGLLVLTFSSCQIVFEMKPDDCAYEKMGVLHDVLVISWYNYEKIAVKLSGGVKEFCILFEEKRESIRRFASLKDIFYVGCTGEPGQERDLFMAGLIKHPTCDVVERGTHILAKGVFTDEGLAEFVRDLATAPSASMTMMKDVSIDHYVCIDTENTEDKVSALLLQAAAIATVSYPTAFDTGPWPPDIDNAAHPIRVPCVRVYGQGSDKSGAYLVQIEVFRETVVNDLAGDRDVVVGDVMEVAFRLTDAQRKLAKLTTDELLKIINSRHGLIDDGGFIYLRNFPKVALTVEKTGERRLIMSLFSSSMVIADKTLIFKGIENAEETLAKLINTLQTLDTLLHLRCEDGVINEYELSKKN